MLRQHPRRFMLFAVLASVALAIAARRAANATEAVPSRDARE